MLFLKVFDYAPKEVLPFMRKIATIGVGLQENQVSFLEHKNMNLSVDKQDISDGSVLFLLRRPYFSPADVPHNDLKPQPRGKHHCNVDPLVSLEEKKSSHGETSRLTLTGWL